jgi:hypothetical protein
MKRTFRKNADSAGVLEGGLQIYSRHSYHPPKLNPTRDFLSSYINVFSYRLVFIPMCLLFIPYEIRLFEDGS